jgi:hypothetical protein
MSDAAGLQFDQAEYAQAPAEMACAQCKRVITTSYYLAGDSALCGLCRNDLERTLKSGSRVGRFARAFGAGSVAAFLGFLLYYGIAALTGYEFGLIAIVVGFAVGSAVRWGSNGRGGWRYQVLAVGLTYLAIVGTYIPPIVEAIREQEAAAGVIESAEDPSVVQIAAEPDTIGAAATGDAGIVRFVVAMAFLIALACAAPFLAGFENVIGIIILAIGLFEAWKLTKRTELTVTGPHAVAKPPTAQAAAV